jgi:hypothetical protein
MEAMKQNSKGHFLFSFRGMFNSFLENITLFVMYKMSLSCFKMSLLLGFNGYLLA